MSNFLYPFSFDNHVAHGAIVQLKPGVAELLDQRSYSDSVRTLLAEVIAAMPLFATHLPFQGRINLQFQALPETRTIKASQTRLLVAQIDHHLNVRAMAKANEDANGSFRELLEGGVLALMIEPRDRQQAASQALVLIEGDRLQQALEGYFAQSEQLPTLIRIAVQRDQLAAFMLQRMPLESSKGTDEDWNHLRILAETVTDSELLELAPEKLLYRLFAEGPALRLFDPREVKVGCNCDHAGISRLLISLGKEEVESILEEQPNVSVTCEFCGKDYVFSPEEARNLFSAVVGEPSGTRH